MGIQCTITIKHSLTLIYKIAYFIKKTESILYKKWKNVPLPTSSLRLYRSTGEKIWCSLKFKFVQKNINLNVYFTLAFEHILI